MLHGQQRIIFLSCRTLLIQRRGIGERRHGWKIWHWGQGGWTCWRREWCKFRAHLGFYFSPVATEGAVRELLERGHSADVEWWEIFRLQREWARRHSVHN